MRKFTVLLAVALLFGISTDFAFAQDRFDTKKPSVSDWISGSGVNSPSLGLIDPSKLTVNHAVSVGGTYSGGQSLMQSIYATQFTYKLSDPVTLQLMLGVQNLQGNNIPGFNTQNSLLGGFRLDYRPSESFHFSMQVNRIPGNMYNSRDWNSGYNSDPLFGNHFDYLQPGRNTEDR